MSKTTLKLAVNKTWFDMILSGEKKEEYRELKEYWHKRFSTHWNKAEKGKGNGGIKEYDFVEFTNGYSKSSPQVTFECLGISKGKPNPKWVTMDFVYFDKDDGCYMDCYIIKIGREVGRQNC